MISSLIVTIASFLTLCVLLLIKVVRDNSIDGLIIVVWIIGIILLVFGLMDLNLLIFHIYINFQGLTTYQWLMNR